MGNARDILASAFNAKSLESDPDNEKAIDRLGAISRASPLGSALWRLKYGNDATSFKPAQHLLVKRMEALAEKQRWTANQRSLIAKLCLQALTEWLGDVCQKCRGKGAILSARYQVVKTVVADRECNRCKGTGKRIWSNNERAKAIGCSQQHFTLYWARKLEDVQNLIASTDRGVNGEINRQLERGS